MPRIAPDTQWQIVVEPSSPNSPAESIVICYMSEVARGKDGYQDACTDAEGYVDLIEQTGAIGGWAMGVTPGNFISAGIVRRINKGKWRVRLDAFEYETETGFNDGYGYLIVKELFA